MNMTSKKPMSKLNWTRALTRIYKELEYISGKGSKHISGDRLIKVIEAKATLEQAIKGE